MVVSPAESAVPKATASAQTTTYAQDDLIGAAEGLFGKGAEGLARLIQNVLKEQGEPNGYIVGREAGGAFFVGLRYALGNLLVYGPLKNVLGLESAPFNIYSMQGMILVEGLLDLPAAVGLDPVVEGGHAAEVVQPGLPLAATVLCGRVGLVVVDLFPSAGGGGVGEDVERGAQVQALAEAFGDLVGVDRGHGGGVDHGLDDEPGLGAEDVADVGPADRSLALPAGHAVAGGDGVLVDVEVQVRDRQQRGRVVGPGLLAGAGWDLVGVERCEERFQERLRRPRRLAGRHTVRRLGIRQVLGRLDR